MTKVTGMTESQCHIEGCERRPFLGLVRIFAWWDGEVMKTRVSGALSCKDHVETIKEEMEDDVQRRAGHTKELHAAPWEPVEPTLEAVTTRIKTTMDKIMADAEADPNYAVLFKGWT